MRYVTINGSTWLRYGNRADFMQIYCDNRKHSLSKRAQLPKDWFGTPASPLFYCFGTPTCRTWRQVKRLWWFWRRRGRLTISFHSPDFPLQKPVSSSTIKTPKKKKNKTKKKQTKENRNKNKQKDKQTKKPPKNNVDRISCFHKRKWFSAFWAAYCTGTQI